MPDISDRRRYDADCSLARALDTLGERWTLLIVRELLPGPLRFSDLKANIAGINATILSRRLEHLSQTGVLRPSDLTTSAMGYELTARGKALWPLLAAYATWDMETAPDLAPGAPLRGLSPTTAMVTLHLRWPPGLQRPAAGFTFGAERIEWRAATEMPFRRGAGLCDLEVITSPEVLHGLAMGHRSTATEEARQTLTLSGPLVETFRRAFP